MIRMWNSVLLWSSIRKPIAALALWFEPTDLKLGKDARLGEISLP